jgi:hypothetical protein
VGPAVAFDLSEPGNVVGQNEAAVSRGRVEQPGARCDRLVGHHVDSTPRGMGQQHRARIGHGSGVINFGRADLWPRKVSLTRHFGSWSADDHRIRMTSLIILVIWLFE